MLSLKHSAILSTFIKLPFVIQIFVLSFFEWLLKTGFTVVVLVVHIDLYTVYELEEKNMILIAQKSSEDSDQPVQMLESPHCSHTQSMVVYRSVEKPCPTCPTWSHFIQGKLEFYACLFWD